MGLPNKRRPGRRGEALIFFGIVDLVYCLSLINPSPTARQNPFLIWIVSVAPLSFWAGLWGGVAVLCLWHAFQRCDRIGFTAAIFIKVFWAGTSLFAWLLGGVDRGYVSAVIWAVFAYFVWRISGWPEADPDRKEPLWTRRRSQR